MGSEILAWGRDLGTNVSPQYVSLGRMGLMGLMGLMGQMGDLGGMGFISSEVSLFSSEKNKNISTLIENSSELKNFCSELFLLLFYKDFIVAGCCIFA